MMKFTEESFIQYIGSNLLNIKGICPQSLANLDFESLIFDQLELRKTSYLRLLSHLENEFGIQLAEEYLFDSSSVTLKRILQCIEKQVSLNR